MSAASASAEVPASVVTDAEKVADAADARAGITTRPARPDELDRVMARFDATWGVGRGPDRSMLQALDHAGNTLLVAIEAPPPVEEPATRASRDPDPEAPLPVEEPVKRASRDPLARTSGFEMPPAASPQPAELLGATLGFLGWSGGVHVHSHMNAVDPSARGRGIGVALKLRQRAVCLAHGVTEVRWTYDPLIRRNARMNLVRLGAEVVAFLPDFYGELRDAISGGDRSDRFEVRWRLDSPRTLRAIDRMPQPSWRAEGGLSLVADFEHVRAEDPEVAARLRDASREAFAVLGSDALRPELDANGVYVFTRDDPDREA